ncbi:MAG: hypothetical protein NTV61_04080 [Candidatus Bathyarchaeota archaeon]|nr:hypothetical protein [Candidatus Bathyarchaeota archaeon]
MDKTIRVDEETYSRLVEQAGRLQTLYRRSISLDEAVKYLLEGHASRESVVDLAGSWDVTDDELSEIRRGLEEGWEKWR